MMCRCLMMRSRLLRPLQWPQGEQLMAVWPLKRRKMPGGQLRLMPMEVSLQRNSQSLLYAWPMQLSDQNCIGHQVGMGGGWAMAAAWARFAAANIGHHPMGFAGGCSIGHGWVMGDARCTMYIVHQHQPFPAIPLIH